MSESEDGGPGTREIANRLFAAEFDDSDLSYSESDEERAPNYVITPSGARVNRLFLAGVLTEEEWVNDEMLRARIVDPTGAFVTYAGQYQPDALAFLERTDSPAFLAVTGKARTFEPEDGDRVFTSVRPESISEVDGDTRDRWVVEAARRTIDRTETMAAAIETGLVGEELTAALEADGVEPSLASGIALALDHYGTTPAYLDALHTLAVEALETVAGERDEVTPLDVAPDEGTGDASALADREFAADAATTTEEPASEQSEEVTDGEPTAEFEPVEEGTTAETEPEATDTEQTGESSPAEAVTSDGVPVATDDAATASEDGIESDESVESDELDESDEPAESDEPGDFELDDVETEIEEELDEFDPEEDDVLTDEEREEVESEFGTEFSTGDEVEPEPELEPEQESASDEEREEAEPTPESETETEPSASESASAATADTDDGGATDSDDADADADDTDEEPADVSVEDAVMEAMATLDDGDGADHDELVATVAEQTGATPDEVEAAVQDALMSGQCYEPADGKFKPI
ncbi:hypothetical protein BRC71_09880 [Halobacteriales archaeon QH_7_65_31]|nr:MAG: hypothetical protein BRC71_09880 [Halobacteriales archaeon QH_7_65_31]